MMDKKIDLHIPSVTGFEKVAMECVASVAREMGFSEDRIEDLKTAVSEACLNAMEHGNRMDASTKVGITLTVEDAKLRVDIKDEGKGFGRMEHPSIEGKVEGEDRKRGWGIFLIKQLMDDVQFESEPEGGNVLRMLIHLEK